MLLPEVDTVFSLKVRVPPYIVIGPEIEVVPPTVRLALLVVFPNVRPLMVLAIERLLIGYVRVEVKELLVGSIVN